MCMHVLTWVLTLQYVGLDIGNHQRFHNYFIILVFGSTVFIEVDRKDITIIIIIIIIIPCRLYGR
jgi:hypothetical protein